MEKYLQREASRTPSFSSSSYKGLWSNKLNIRTERDGGSHSRRSGAVLPPAEDHAEPARQTGSHRFDCCSCGGFLRLESVLLVQCRGNPQGRHIVQVLVPRQWHRVECGWFGDVGHDWDWDWDRGRGRGAAAGQPPVEMKVNMESRGSVEEEGDSLQPHCSARLSAIDRGAHCIRRGGLGAGC